jgi:tRNA(Ile)-lysidine synthase
MEKYAVTQRQRRLIGVSELAACGCEPEDKVLVAFSGGADSTALLLSMRELLEQGRIGGLFAAHLNHGIRGAAAERDMRFCESLCAELGVPIAVESADVPSLARERGESIEQAARDVRYAFLERARQSFGADAIATAHHLDDQAETVLLHLMRGSGLTGLCGMQPRNGAIVRPMLGVSRAQILAYLGERRAAYCEDETNAENGPLRNRIRNELVPLLKTFNPNVARALNATASLVSQDEAYLALLAREAEHGCSMGDGLDRSKLHALPAPLKSRIVYSRLMSLNGGAAQPDIRRVLALCKARTGTRIELPGGVSAWTDAGALYIGAYPGSAEYEMPFISDGETATPRGVFVCEHVDGWQKPESGSEAFLDLDALPEGLVVRSRRNGDRFFPLGAPGERKLSDVLTDKKIPKERRDLPLLCAGDTVYYAAGLTVSERAKVTPDTREILHITFNGGDRG